MTENRSLIEILSGEMAALTLLEPPLTRADILGTLSTRPPRAAPQTPRGARPSSPPISPIAPSAETSFMVLQEDVERERDLAKSGWRPQPSGRMTRSMERASVEILPMPDVPPRVRLNPGTPEQEWAEKMRGADPSLRRRWIRQADSRDFPLLSKNMDRTTFGRITKVKSGRTMIVAATGTGDAVAPDNRYYLIKIIPMDVNRGASEYRKGLLIGDTAAAPAFIQPIAGFESTIAVESRVVPAFFIVFPWKDCVDLTRYDPAYFDSSGVHMADDDWLAGVYNLTAALSQVAPNASRSTQLRYGDLNESQVLVTHDRRLFFADLGLARVTVERPDGRVVIEDGSPASSGITEASQLETFRKIVSNITARIVDAAMRTKISAAMLGRTFKLCAQSLYATIAARIPGIEATDDPVPF
jgi:hypothetical protein